MRVLVVEDDPVMQKLTARILRDLDYQPDVYADGELAWRAILDDPPRIVISDWVMPNLDGLQLCERVRARKDIPYTYFILVSAARQTPEDFRNAVARGVDDFLSKPLDPDRVWARLHVAERILSFTAQIGIMGRLIPICSYCRKIRNDEDYWDQLESFIQQQTGSTFSHGVCPDCYQRIMREEGVPEPPHGDSSRKIE